jgi:hypothetical protein
LAVTASFQAAENVIAQHRASKWDMDLHNKNNSSKKAKVPALIQY